MNQPDAWDTAPPETLKREHTARLVRADCPDERARDVPAEPRACANSQLLANVRLTVRRSPVVGVGRDGRFCRTHREAPQIRGRLFDAGFSTVSTVCRLRQCESHLARRAVSRFERAQTRRQFPMLNDTRPSDTRVGVHEGERQICRRLKGSRGSKGSSASHSARSSPGRRRGGVAGERSRCRLRRTGSAGGTGQSTAASIPFAGPDTAARQSTAGSGC